MCAYYVASDIGGTFTDTVLIDNTGSVARYKSPTVPTNPADGVVRTLRDAATDCQMELSDLLADVAIFAHGTTIATNALLEGEGKRVGLIETRGFGDTLSIMRGFKSLGLAEEQVKQFRTLVKQSPAVPKSRTAEVSERLDYQGRVVRPLDEDDVRRAIVALREAGADVFAVSLLWSFKNDAHEHRVAELVREVVPDASVTLSSYFLPRIGEYQRSLTTAVNASLRPVLTTSLDSFARTLGEAGLQTTPLLMQSNGGIATPEEVEKRPAATVMSGPVGGVVASQRLGTQHEHRNIVTTDMGGTSFDVGLVIDGETVMSNTTLIGRDQLALPSVAVRTVGAGAGSLASVHRGVLTVGPESAGADPGPACYGRGGTHPTVADADLVLGYLNPANFLGGRLHLEVDRARRAVEQHVATPLDISVEEAAEGIKTIVDARMADLIRQVTVEQGHDPSDFVMFAYGGAGPTHAFSYGAELGTRNIIVPLTASVQSAFGIASSDLTMVEELSKPMQSTPGATDYASALPPEQFTETFNRLESTAHHKLLRAGANTASVQFSRSVEMRFRTQIHVLTVPAPGGQLTNDDVDTLVERFVDQYEGRFGKGSAFKEGGVEITTFRVVATSPVHNIQLAANTPARVRDLDDTPTRPVFCGGQWVQARIVQAEQLREGMQFTGLAVVEMPDTTVVVGQQQTATVDDFGNLIINALA